VTEPGERRSPSSASVEIARRRAEALTGPLIAPFGSMVRPWFWAVLGSAVLGGFVAILTRQPVLAVGVTLLAALASAAFFFRPALDRPFRRAMELFYDHLCHERWEWKQETGVAMPSTPARMRQWLLAHPTGPGRASILLAVGRLDDAERAIDEIRPATPEEAYGVDILRAQRTLFGGAIPDVTGLHASWRGLPDPRERRHRRECLAVLDAMIAADRGADPIPVLAAARDDIPEVHPSMRASRLLARWIGIPTTAAAAAVLAFGSS
jgi:hypothetical protein